MITRDLSIENNHTTSTAPKYKNDTILLIAQKAIITRRATIKGKSIVDIQCKDITGKKYVMMATGEVIEKLGVASRENIDKSRNNIIIKVLKALRSIF